MAEQDNTEETAHLKPDPPEDYTVTLEPPDSYVFSNVAAVAVTPWDIRINFVDVVPSPQSKEGRFKAKIGVTMPAECAAGLALLLIDQLRAFESQFGSIRNEKWANAQKKAAETTAKLLKSDPSK